MSKRTLVILTVIAGLVVAGAIGAYALTQDVIRDDVESGTDEGIEVEDPLTADPTVAAQSAIATLFSWDPAEQASPQAAAASIADRLSGELYDYAVGEPDPVVPPQWQSWASAGDRVHAVAIPSEDGVVGDDGPVVVDLTLRQEIWHPDGERTPFHEAAVAVTVELVEGEWKPASYEYLSTTY